jgi:hypothetical protein
MGAKREYWPWNTAVTTSPAPEGARPQASEHLDEVMGPNVSLPGQDAPAGQDDRQQRVATAALAPSTGLDELADGLIAKVRPGAAARAIGRGDDSPALSCR